TSLKHVPERTKFHVLCPAEETASVVNAHEHLDATHALISEVPCDTVWRFRRKPAIGIDHADDDPIGGEVCVAFLPNEGVSDVLERIIERRCLANSRVRRRPREYMEVRRIE